MSVIARAARWASFQNLSIVFRQQQGRCAPISLRDDPELLVLPRAVRREQTPAIAQGLVVQRLVFGANVAPIARGMTAHEVGRRLA